MLRDVAKVGYAFVNFVSAHALYLFVKARVGKRWNMFSSDKVLQVRCAVPWHDPLKLTAAGVLCEHPVRCDILAELPAADTVIRGKEALVNKFR